MMKVEDFCAQYLHHGQAVPVMVHWVDSMLPDVTWRHIEDIPTGGCISCRTLGFAVAGPCGDTLYLAMSYAGATEEYGAQLCGLMRIPFCAITGIERVGP